MNIKKFIEELQCKHTYKYKIRVKNGRVCVYSINPIKTCCKCKKEKLINIMEYNILMGKILSVELDTIKR